MPTDVARHRRSIRLRNYDFSTTGAYFVTVCTSGRACLFGDVVDGEMRLNEAGAVVVECWANMPEHFPHVTLDAFVVMPNHVHGIVVIERRGTACRAPENPVVKGGQARYANLSNRDKIFSSTITRRKAP